MDAKITCPWHPHPLKWLWQLPLPLADPSMASGKVAGIGREGGRGRREGERNLGSCPSGVEFIVLDAPFIILSLLNRRLGILVSKLVLPVDTNKGIIQ